MSHSRKQHTVAACQRLRRRLRELRWCLRVVARREQQRRDVTHDDADRVRTAKGNAERITDVAAASLWHTGRRVAAEHDVIDHWVDRPGGAKQRGLPHDVEHELRRERWTQRVGATELLDELWNGCARWLGAGIRADGAHDVARVELHVEPPTSFRKVDHAMKWRIPRSLHGGGERLEILVFRVAGGVADAVGDDARRHGPPRIRHSYRAEDGRVTRWRDAVENRRFHHV